MKRRELVETLTEVRAIWRRREARRPDRFPDVGEFMDAIGKGLLSDDKPDRFEPGRIRGLTDAGLVAELELMRRQLDQANQAVMDCKEFRPTPKNKEPKMCFLDRLKNYDDDNLEMED